MEQQQAHQTLGRMLIQLFLIQIRTYCKRKEIPRHEIFWSGPVEKLELFLMLLNPINSNLQFAMEVAGNELYFLDLN